MAIWHKTKANIIKEMKLKRHRARNDVWIILETFKLTLENVNENQRFVLL